MTQPANLGGGGEDQNPRNVRSEARTCVRVVGPAAAAGGQGRRAGQSGREGRPQQRPARRKQGRKSRGNAFSAIAALERGKAGGLARRA